MCHIPKTQLFLNRGSSYLTSFKSSSVCFLIVLGLLLFSLVNFSMKKIRNSGLFSTIAFPVFFFLIRQTWKNFADPNLYMINDILPTGFYILLQHLGFSRTSPFIAHPYAIARHLFFLVNREIPKGQWRMIWNLVGDESDLLPFSTYTRPFIWGRIRTRNVRLIHTSLSRVLWAYHYIKSLGACYRQTSNNSLSIKNAIIPSHQWLDVMVPAWTFVSRAC